VATDPTPEETGPRLLVALFPGPESSELESRLTSSGSSAARWIRSADGLRHPGDHVGLLEYEYAGDPTIESASSDLAVIGDATSLPESICVVGRELPFIPGRSDRTRLWYFMRRRHDYTHADYLDRYHRVHSSFGLRTPGIDAYTQFHVDPERSAIAAARLGCGVFGFDSVSILDMSGLDDFLAAVVTSPVGEEAIRDEERFVDRARSWDYVTRRIG
jgi:hypothetical protein